RKSHWFVVLDFRFALWPLCALWWRTLFPLLESVAFSFAPFASFAVEVSMPFPRSKKVYDAPGLYEYAVQALGRRMRTIAELKRLLRQKNFDGDRDAAIEAVVIKLKDQHYLNDANYA